MQWVWDESLLQAGHRAGLAAIGRGGLPQADAVAARFAEAYMPSLWLPGAVEEIEYPGLVRELLGHFGVEPTDEELDRFLDAEHEAWMPARRLGATTHALLESLRARELKLGLVSHAFDPPPLLHRDLERMGVAARLDAAVFSSELGKRKPHPAIFERALAELEVDAERAVFVGDQLVADVGGAAGVGMTPGQALWLRADPSEDGPEPDYQTFTQVDVLNVVRRLNGA